MLELVGRGAGIHMPGKLHRAAGRAGRLAAARAAGGARARRAGAGAVRRLRLRGAAATLYSGRWRTRAAKCARSARRGGCGSRFATTASSWSATSARAIVGGHNIAPEYTGDGITHGWRDLALLIEGPIGAELAATFHAMYALAPMSGSAIREFRAAGALRNRKETAGTVRLLTAVPVGPPAS